MFLWILNNIKRDIKNNNSYFKKWLLNKRIFIIKTYYLTVYINQWA